MWNTNWIFALFILQLLTSCIPQEQPAEKQDTGSKLITIGSKHKLKSAILNEEREYWVYLPEDYYDTTYSPYNYPVLYVLDGDRHFHSLSGIQNFLSSGPYTSLPEMIIVGILNTDRPRDLTPTHHNRPDIGPRHAFPTSGGGDNFLQFIEEELMTEINSRYRTNDYKLLAGHSFGGLTTIYALLSKPELFNAYIAIDPSIWWDDNYLLKKARKELDSMDLSGRRLYLAQANFIPIPMDTTTEHERALSAFKNELKTVNNGLKWQYKFYSNEDHGTIPLIAEYDGLRFIFEGFQSEIKMVAEDPQLIIDNYEQLSENLGYQIIPTESLIDWVANYSLRMGNKDQAKKLFELNATLYPRSEHAQSQSKKVN